MRGRSTGTGTVAAEVGRRHVAVLGGGFAGLTAALSLAASGCRVTLIEARPCLGGKARAVPAAGASVDLGPTLLDDVGPLAALALRAGTALSDLVAVERVTPGLVATFPGPVALAWDVAGGRLAATLGALGPAAARDWSRVADVGERAIDLTEHFLARGDVAPTDILPSLARGDVGPLRAAARFIAGGVRLRRAAIFARHPSLADLLDAIVETPALRALLGHFARFVGLDARRAPSVMLVIAYRLATRGVWYPRGGFAALAGSLASLARKHGVEIAKDVRVTGLEVGAGRVRAVCTAEGGLSVDACVAAMDVGTVAGWLPSHPLARRVARLRPSSAARVAWWVVEGPPPAATHHGLHFDRGEEPLYVAMPTVTDPALAPGHTIVHAVLHHPAADGGSPCGADGEMLESVPRRLGARGMWPAGRVVARGADGDGTPCYGYAVGPGLVRAFPPSQRVRGLANLVLAGGSVFPGPGVANTVRSGLRAADLALGALA